MAIRQVGDGVPVQLCQHVIIARAADSAARRRGGIAKTLSAGAKAEVKAVHQLAEDDMILDIGDDVIARYIRLIEAGRHNHLERPDESLRFPPIRPRRRSLGARFVSGHLFPRNRCCFLFDVFSANIPVE